MMLNLKSKEVNIKKVSDGYSAKIGSRRMCNFECYGDMYEAKCRSKKCADLLPVDCKIKDDFKETRNYYTYISKTLLTKKQLETWIDKLAQLDPTDWLENREKF